MAYTQNKHILRRYAVISDVSHYDHDIGGGNRQKKITNVVPGGQNARNDKTFEKTIIKYSRYFDRKLSFL